MIERIEPGTRMSKAVIHNGTVYIAGQVSGDAADVAGQTQQVLAKVDEILAAAKTDKSKVLFANVWLADIASFDEMNAVWDAWILPGSPPARATVEAHLASPSYRVEIAVIAAR
ncbi:MAG: RidA family protein [Candidatus Eremiobacteraeota bacterium]|nr:RidA family protein [Candidatus Eremiobacteraeota bacterium]